MFKRNSKIQAILLAIMAAGGLMTGCSLLPQEEKLLEPPLVEPAKPQYELAEVKLKEISKSLKGVASFIPVKYESIAFLENGKLKAIHVKRGDEVKKGALLAELDAGDLELQLAMTEIRYEQAKLRFMQLLENGGADETTIAISKLDLKSMELELNHLRKKREATRVVAPIDGVVDYLAELLPGDQVFAGTSIAQIADKKQAQFVYTAQLEDEIKALREVSLGMPAKLTIEGEQSDGIIVQTPLDIPSDVPQDLRERMKQQLYIRPTKDMELIFGRTASVEIFLKKKDSTLVIPRRALWTFNDRNYVQVLDGAMKREYDVELGIVTPTEVEILSGLQAGDQVILK